MKVGVQGNWTELPTTHRRFGLLVWLVLRWLGHYGFLIRSEKQGAIKMGKSRFVLPAMLRALVAAATPPVLALAIWAAEPDPQATSDKVGLNVVECRRTAGGVEVKVSMVNKTGQPVKAAIQPALIDTLGHEYAAEPWTTGRPIQVPAGLSFTMADDRLVEITFPPALDTSRPFTVNFAFAIPATVTPTKFQLNADLPAVPVVVGSAVGPIAGPSSPPVSAGPAAAANPPNAAPGTGEDFVQPVRVLPVEDAVSCLAFSPDDSRLLVSSHAKPVQMYDVATGRRLPGSLSLESQSSGTYSPTTKTQTRVKSLAFANDGQAWLVDSWLGVFLWEPGKGLRSSIIQNAPDQNSQWTTTAGDGESRELRAHVHRGIVLGVADLPGLGPHAAINDVGHDCVLVNVATGKETRRFRDAHMHRLRFAIFSANGNVILTADHEGFIAVWNLINGKLIRQFELPALHVVGLAPDGRQAILAALPTRPPGSTNSPPVVVRNWDLLNSRELWTHEFRNLRSVALLPNGAAIVIGDRLEFWDPAADRKLGIFPSGEALAISTDGQYVALGRATERKLVLLPTPPMSTPTISEEQHGTDRGRDIGRFSNRLERGTHFRLLTRGEETPSSMSEDTLFVKGFSFLKDGRTAASVNEGPSGEGGVELKIWDLGTARPTHQQHVLKGQYVKRAVFSADGRRVALGTSRSYRMTARGNRQEPQRFMAAVWDVESGRPLCQLDLPCPLSAIAISPDGKYLAATLDPFGCRGFTGDERAIYVWDTKGKLQRNLPTANIGDPTLLSFSQDSRFFMSVHNRGNGSVLWVWDLKTGSPVRQILSQGSEINCLSLTQDGRRALTGHSDQTMRLWDMTNGKELRQFPGHSQKIVAVAFLPTAKRGLSAADRQLRLWDLETGQVLRTIPTGEDTKLAVNLQGDAVLTGAGEVHYWPLGAK